MTPRRSSTELAVRVRRSVLQMVHRARASHVGSCLSAADVLAVLYGGVLNISPERRTDPQRDRFVLSKGHAAAALYATLAEVGFIPREWLERFGADGSPLAGHALHTVPGVEVSTGSLGHGLPLALGMALAGRGQNQFNVYVLMSDGECDEGSVWEAALFAGHHRLSNVTCVIDYNRIQSFGRVEQVLTLEPFADKWRAFGWDVVELDGHDHDALKAALRTRADAAPRLLVLHTTKGKGVSFMEDQLVWHYRSPSDAELEQALEELGLPE